VVKIQFVSSTNSSDSPVPKSALLPLHFVPARLPISMAGAVSCGAEAQERMRPNVMATTRDKKSLVFMVPPGKIYLCKIYANSGFTTNFYDKCHISRN